MAVYLKKKSDDLNCLKVWNVTGTLWEGGWLKRRKQVKSKTYDKQSLSHNSIIHHGDTNSNTLTSRQRDSSRLASQQESTYFV